MRPKYGNDCTNVNFSKENYSFIPCETKTVGNIEPDLNRIDYGIDSLILDSNVGRTNDAIQKIVLHSQNPVILEQII